MSKSNVPPNNPASSAGAGPVLPLAGKPGRMKLILTIFVAGWIGIIFLLTLGVEAYGIGNFGVFLAAMLMAMLPVPVLILLAFFLDRYESEPIWMLAVAFFWGATIAILFAGMFNTLNAAILMKLLGKGMGDALAAPLSAPPVEEISKAMVLFAFFFFKKDEFDGVLDGILYAAMVGLGFAMTENITYYAKGIAQGGTQAAAVTFFLRCVMGAYGHPLFTSMTGIGLGLSRQSDNPLVKKIAPVAGLCGAMFLHFLWNLSGLFGLIQFFMVYLAVMFPALVAVLVVAWFAIKRDSDIVRQHLSADLQSDWINPAEMECLCKVRSRLKTSLAAWKAGGLSAWKRRVAYHQLTSELALCRWRMSKGISSKEQGAQVEVRTIARLRELYAAMAPVSRAT
ncbi:MAG: PrsW family intramembrane metalloprotease [Phycisphaerales bacterium]|nr:PrsW family intramembrane metalloprotease [Phycisphaerales bacterium]